jgi:serine/threonine protein kinase
MLDVFEQAVSLDPTEREAFLDSSCASDTLLRRTVKEMIDSHAQAETEGFMESPVVSYLPPDSNPRAMIGQQVGSYRLTQFIDQGGMGVVYLAEPADGFFRRQAAVKLIRADLDPKEYRRFRREVQILADLKHPNLVFLYEAGRMPDGRAYLAMEYVEGLNLRDWLRTRGPMPIAKVVEVAKQASAGLDAAHSAKVIHRDIKPGNIIVAETGGALSVKVLDFGIAARKDSESSAGSGAESLIGTVLYMSPEQLLGQDLTPASDVYALGLTVYELLTGQPAINGDSQIEIITKHLTATPAAPSRIRPDLNITVEVDRVVMKALAKDPRERYQTAPEFAADLEAAYRLGSATTTPEKITPPPQPPRRQIVYNALLFAFIVIVGVAIYRLWPRGQESPLQAQSANSPAPSTAAPSPPGLKIQLDVQNPARATYSGCAFALYRPEVAEFPERTTPENTLVILININSRSEPKASRYESVPPGEYLTKFACAGFKTVRQRSRVAADPRHQGYATIPVRLERE